MIYLYSGLQKEMKSSVEDVTSTRSSATCHTQGPPFNKILLPLPPPPPLSPFFLFALPFRSPCFKNSSVQKPLDGPSKAGISRARSGEGGGGPAQGLGAQGRKESVSNGEQSERERISQASLMQADRQPQCQSSNTETRMSKLDGSLVKIRRMSM